MMTSVLDRVPLDEITGQAREARPGRTALTVIAAVLFGLGWCAARLFAVLWLAVTWAFTAVRVGWQAAHGPSRATQLETLRAERDRWREEARRLGG